MKKQVSYVLAAALLAAPTVAMADDHKGKDHKAKHLEKVDTNKDGKISLDEFLAQKKEHFTKVDVDADGFLTKEEMKAAHQKMKKKFKGKRGKHGCDKGSPEKKFEKAFEADK